MIGARDIAAPALALLALAAAAPAARADYGPGAEPASAVGTSLGSLASGLPSISDDGRYVAFDTAAPELLGAPADPAQHYARGIVRKDLRTGAAAVVGPPQRVAGDDDPPTIVAPGAIGTSSISGSGRYVAFETVEPLSPSDRNGALDVYVRDMDRPLTDDGAYELASALDGTTDAADYGTGGSRIGPAAALSDDGRTAVFFTSGRSNLPSGGAIGTPGGQVLVRDLDAHRTILLTRTLAGGGPVTEPGDLLPRPAISGDGTTVVWMDANSAAQVPLLPGEPNPPGAFLWRRVADAATLPPRRVSGASDLEDPACDHATPYVAGDAITGPCYGPFVLADATSGDNDANRIADPPSISDDGLRVLFRSSAKRRPYDAVTARAAGTVYLADMREGLPRKVAVPAVVSVTGAKNIDAAVLSGDGRHVALTSPVSAFEGLQAVGTLPSAATGATDVWIADVDAGTIQRATTAPDGSDYHGQLRDADTPGTYDDPAPKTPVVDDAARTVAFSAADGNLFLGDANGVPDVEVVRGASGASTGPGAVTALPAPGGGTIAGRSLPALPEPRAVYPVVGYPSVGADGVARLAVRVPAAGTVTGEATTNAGRRTTRAAARAHRTTKAATTVTLRFVPVKAVKRRLRRGAVRATIAVRYAPRSGRATSVRRAITFPRRRPAR